MTLNYRSLVMITRADLDDAVTAASEHIAPCGHNELGNLYGAVEAAFTAVGIAVESHAEISPPPLKPTP